MSIEELTEVSPQYMGIQNKGYDAQKASIEIKLGCMWLADILGSNRDF